MDLRLGGKKALVTGASAGIGFATALKLARNGVKVAICGRDAERLEDAAIQIKEKTGVAALPVSADLTDQLAIKQLVQEVHQHFGSIDILINNVGNGIYKPFLEITEEELIDGIKINLLATFRMCREVIPHMLVAGKGSIVNVTGISGSCTMAPPFFSSCTGPLKAAENRLTKTLAMEFGPKNIRVNAVSPGRINAPERLERWLEKIEPGAPSKLSVNELKKRWGHQISLPDHRWGEVDEIANLIVFVSSDSCGFMTGEIVVADGGETHD